MIQEKAENTEKTSFLQFAFIKGTNLQILHSQGTQKKIGFISFRLIYNTTNWGAVR